MQLLLLCNSCVLVACINNVWNKYVLKSTAAKQRMSRIMEICWVFFLFFCSYLLLWIFGVWQKYVNTIRDLTTIGWNEKEITSR